MNKTLFQLPLCEEMGWGEATDKAIKDEKCTTVQECDAIVDSMKNKSWLQKKE